VDKKALNAGLVGGVVILAISTVLSMMMQAIFSYKVLALDGMRAVDDPIMGLFFLHPWVLSFAMVFAYPYVGRTMRGNYLEKGKKFGLLVWVLAEVPSAFLVYTSMDYPIGFTVNSVVSTLLYVVGGGIVIARMMEKK
jgi:hypothetical protein